MSVMNLSSISRFEYISSKREISCIFYGHKMLQNISCTLNALSATFTNRQSRRQKPVLHSLLYFIQNDAGNINMYNNQSFGRSFLCFVYSF